MILATGPILRYHLWAVQGSLGVCILPSRGASRSETGQTHTRYAMPTTTLLIVITFGVLGAVMLFLLYRLHVNVRNTECPPLDDTALLDTHFFESAPIGIFRSVPDGSHFLYANKHLAHFCGWSNVEDMVARQRPRDLYPDPTVRDRLIARLRVERNLTTAPLELRQKHLPTRYCVLHLTMHPDDLYVEGWVQDVTELIYKERALTESHAFLQGVVDALPNPLFYKDLQGRYRLVNTAFCRMLSMPSSQLLGKTVYDISPAQLASVYEQMDLPLLQAQGAASQRYESQVSSSGGVRHVLFDKASVLDVQGRVVGLVGLITDITRRKEYEEALTGAEARIRALVRNATDGIFTAAPSGQLEDANPALCAMLGLPDEDPLGGQGRAVTMLSDFMVEGRDRWVAIVEQLRTERVVPQVDVEFVRADGQRIWLSLALWSVRHEGGDHEPTFSVEGVAHDITDRKLVEQDLTRRAVTDPLTGLHNRAHIEAVLPSLLRQAERTSRTLGLLFMDLDGFKAINDSYGHAVGDSLLAQVADRLRKRLRHSDLAVRMGGDEFAVLLWDVPNASTVERIGSAILGAMESEFHCDGVPCRVTASIGASIYPLHGLDAPALLHSADKAMYKAKELGKNRMAFAE